MGHIKNITFYAFMLLCVNSIWADESNYWQCTVIDDDNNQWTEKNLYQPPAANKAFDACKKQSQKPASCRFNDDTCESFIHGLSTRAAWQCTAFDSSATSWSSGPFTQQDDAVFAAKAKCKENSQLPETCYVNLLTCKNRNPWPPT